MRPPTQWPQLLYQLHKCMESCGPTWYNRACNTVGFAAHPSLRICGGQQGCHVRQYSLDVWGGGRGGGGGGGRRVTGEKKLYPGPKNRLSASEAHHHPFVTRRSLVTKVCLVTLVMKECCYASVALSLIFGTWWTTPFRKEAPSKLTVLAGKLLDKSLQHANFVGCI